MFAGIETVTIFFFALVLLWLLSLSFFLVRAVRHYNLLTRDVKKKSLSSILEETFKKLKMAEQDIKSLKKRLAKEEEKSRFYLQRVGLLRFNPFAETGGEQSFIVSLLDKNNNGIVLTSLQGRTGTRWYSKIIKQGKGLDFKLSKEEEEAIRKARSLDAKVRAD